MEILCGKENVAVDALSRVAHMLVVQVVYCATRLDLESVELICN